MFTLGPKVLENAGFLEIRIRRVRKVLKTNTYGTLCTWRTSTTLELRVTDGVYDAYSKGFLEIPKNARIVLKYVAVGTISYHV